MTIDDLGFATEFETVSDRGVSKSLLALIAAAVLVVVFALATAYTWLVGNNGTAAALEEYERASQTLDSSVQNIASLSGEHQKVMVRAEKAHTGGLAVAAAASKDTSLFKPKSSIKELEKAVAKLTKTANLRESADGKVSAATSEPQEIDKDLFKFTASNDRQTLKNATRQISGSQAHLDAYAETITTEAKSTKEAIEDVRAKAAAVIAAARASHKAWERPEQSSDESWATYQDSLAKLRTAPEETLARQAKIIAKYVKTRTAVQKSHDDRVAAIAAQQHQAYLAAQQREAARQAASQAAAEKARADAARKKAADSKKKSEESSKKKGEPKPSKTTDNQISTFGSDVVYRAASCAWSDGPVTYLASKGWNRQSAMNHCAAD